MQQRDSQGFEVRGDFIILTLEYYNNSKYLVVFNWRKNMNFNTRASKAFNDLFEYPSMPLPGYAYALLSNWFKTSLKFIVESPRGIAALEFWEKMFCAVPEKRLTNPKRNDVILKERFELWCPKQQKCQEDC